MKKAGATPRRAGRMSRFRRRLVTVLAMATAGVMLTAGAAHATITNLDDLFDNNPASRWTVESTDRDGGVRFLESSAEIYNLDVGPNDYTSISREFVISPFSVSHRCEASMWVVGAFDGSTATVNFEVIDPRTWTYLSLKRATVKGTNLQRINLPNWSNGPPRFVFRVSLFGANSFRSVEVIALWMQCDI
jgi:hypothetical protein